MHKLSHFSRVRVCADNILQSYSNQNSMVLAQKQMHGSMEQNQEMIKDLNKTVELLEEKAF